MRLARTSWRALASALMLLGAVVLGRDVAPRIGDALGRRAMASDLPDTEYLEKVRRTALSLFGADVPTNDHTRLLLVDDVRSLLRPQLAYSWPDAALAKGVALSDGRRPSPPNVAALVRYLEGFLGEPLRTLDQAMNGEALLYAARVTSDARFRARADELADYLLRRARSEGGTLAYRPATGDGTGDLRFVDTLGLVCPFLAQYGATAGAPEATALAVRQLEAFVANGLDPRSGLPFQAYNPRHGNAPVGAVGWGRGTGWYALGLVDTLAWVPEEARAALRPAAVALAARLREYERPGGGWGALLNAPSPFDSSATAMLAYFLVRARQQGLAGPEVDPAVERAVAALKRHTRAGGLVDFAQGNCNGLNDMSESYRPAPYAQGMTLALLASRGAR